MQPGDVFVYPARYGQTYGHAVMVVDVAVNKHGKKAFLLAEGNTPAREIHIMRNFENPIRSPWFMLDEDADNLILSVFHYKATDLKHFWKNKNEQNDEALLRAEYPLCPE